MGPVALDVVFVSRDLRKPARDVLFASVREVYWTWPFVGSLSVKNWKLLKKFAPL